MQNFLFIQTLHSIEERGERHIKGIENKGGEKHGKQQQQQQPTSCSRC